jgi:hypothetical protein
MDIDIPLNLFTQSKREREKECDAPFFEVCTHLFQSEIDIQTPWCNLIPIIGRKEKPLPPTLVD